MSLNRKRRIFRSSSKAVPFAAGLIPGPRVLFAMIGSATMLAAGAWLFTRPSEAPAQAPATARLVVDAAHVAVVDGATLRMHDRVVRLNGLTPPARGETCHLADGRDVDCGVASANALAALVRDGLVDCTMRPRDRGQGGGADCVSGGTELNRAQVLAGWATADGSFAPEQRQARMAQRGVWAGEAAAH
ncbi:MAG: thermonuclease family protein [Acetobacteraceae bacterium]